MSYDIYLKTPVALACEHCGRGASGGGLTVYQANMTSNISGIWFRALLKVQGLQLPAGWDEDLTSLGFGGAPHPLSEVITPSARQWPNPDLGAFGPLAGLKGKHAAEICFQAADHIRRNPAEYKKFEPDNGWGSAIGAADFLGTLAIAWTENPSAVLEVSR